MGMQTMGSHGDGNNSGKQAPLQPLARQNSMYNLTLDEVQHQLGDLGKPLTSMNLDELIKSVLSAETNQCTNMEVDDSSLVYQNVMQRQASFSLTGPLSKKTVDEVWRDIQQSKANREKKYRDRQPTLGEMTLEDFLVKAGVVADTPSGSKDSDVIPILDPTPVPMATHYQPQAPVPWMQYPLTQYQHPQSPMMGVFMPAQPLPPPIHMGASPLIDGPYMESPVGIHSPLMGTLSDSQLSARKRATPEDLIEKSAERRQKRMIKNRESAARSRARKQAYTNELENKVSRLEEENEMLRKLKELENSLPSTSLREPKYQLRRTSSASF